LERAVPLPAVHDLVVGGDHVEHVDVDVGERLTVAADRPLDPLPVLVAHDRIVVDEVICAHLVDHTQVSLVERLVDQSARRGYFLLAHASSPPVVVDPTLRLTGRERNPAGRWRPAPPRTARSSIIVAGSAQRWQSKFGSNFRCGARAPGARVLRSSPCAARSPSPSSPSSSWWSASWSPTPSSRGWTAVATPWGWGCRRTASACGSR